VRLVATLGAIGSANVIQGREGGGKQRTCSLKLHYFMKRIKNIFLYEKKESRKTADNKSVDQEKPEIENSSPSISFGLILDLFLVSNFNV